MSSDLIQEIAAELGVSDGTRQQWRTRGYVPHRWRLPILTAAEARGAKINPAVFDHYRPSNYRGQRGARVADFLSESKDADGVAA